MSASTCSFSRRSLWKSLKHVAVKWFNLKNVIDISTFLVWDPMFGTWLDLIFSSKFLFESWCSISESVNHVSDHGFKCSFLGSAISTGKSDCVMKFRFASMFRCLMFAGVASSSNPLFSLDLYFLQKCSVAWLSADAPFQHGWFYFDIIEDDRLASQTVDTLFCSQLTFFVLALKIFSWLFYLPFFAIKITSVLSMFSRQFLCIFASYLNLIVCLKVFLTRKFESSRV